MTNITQLPDGLYFGLSEDSYYGQHRFSASGVKSILVHPMKYWADSWMNPLKAEQVEEKEAQTVGKAYHKRILEGASAFYDCYAPTFSAAEFPDALDTKDDLMQALDEIGIQYKKSAAKPELIRIVREYLPHKLILQDLIDNHKAKHGSQKTFLSPQLIAKIEHAGHMIEAEADIRNCFRGGYPEVSVLWTHNGVRMKSRFDYLKVRAFTDLKSYADRGRTIDYEIHGQVGFNKYHIQIAVYFEALKHAQQFARDPNTNVTGHVDAEWLEEFAKTEDFGAYLVFQEKGPAALVSGWQITQDDFGMALNMGWLTAEKAIAEYNRCWEKFGTEPWNESLGIRSLSDQLLPQSTYDL